MCNETVVDVVVQAQQMKGAKLLLEVVDDVTKSVLYSKTLEVSSSDYLNRISFFITPKTPGVQKYYVELMAWRRLV